MDRLKTKIRKETFINTSGKLLNLKSIKVLKEKNYYVKPHSLDGDAPKSFIKAYIYNKRNNFRKKNLKSWNAFIAKSAEKWYPHESVIEYMINRIGQEMGIIMNEVELVIINEQIRFLSKYFRNKNEILIHGAEICGQYLNDNKLAKEIAEDKQNARELFTFEFLIEAIESVFPNSYNEIIEDLVKMITFDAVSGNNDRHFYNWGVIDSAFKNRKNPKFAPVYDSARSFLWNWSDSEIIKHWKLIDKGGQKINNYIQMASPRISCEENLKANHFELIKFLKNNNPKYKNIILKLVSKENEQNVLKMLKNEFFSFFIEERNKAIIFIVKERYERIRNL